MGEEFFAHALAVVGTVCYIVRAGPATFRIARGHGIDPDAGLTLGLLFLTGVWWGAYSLEIHNWPSLISAAVGMVAPAFGLTVLARAHAVKRGIVFVLAAGLVVIFFEEELSPRVMGLTAAVGAAGIAIPQTVRLLRNRDESAADASLGTWALLAFNGVVWLFYGFLVGHPLIGAPGLVAIPSSLLIMHRIRRDRRAAEFGGGGST